MTDPTNQDRRPRRCEPATPRHVADVWLLLSEGERQRVSLAAVRAGLIVADYIAVRIEVCKVALFERRTNLTPPPDPGGQKPLPN